MSLLEGPLLVGDLPEARVFSRKNWLPCVPKTALNLEQKLGHLYEDALALVLGEDLLEQNFQLRKDIHTTVGELDFLLCSKNDGPLIHLELATKFYLAVNTPNGLVFPGPDARDNYQRKLQRLREHQLTLTQQHRDCLPECYRKKEIEVRQLIYGCLFDHIETEKIAHPDWISPNCRRGRWLHLSECHHHFRPETEFRLIPKPLWPVPLRFLDRHLLARWKPPENLDRCVMVAVEEELQPYFIAPSTYPKSV